MFGKSKNIIFTSLTILIVFFPFVSSAQLNLTGSQNLSSELSIEITPEYPRPKEKTFVSLTMYTADLNSAEIFWYKNGKLENSGKGVTNFVFNMGGLGENTKIEILVKLLNGQVFSRVMNFNPASVDIIWEAFSLSHHLFKGKSLHSNQGLLKIVAMPEFINNGSIISPENLIYEWSNDNEVYFENSGYGKRVLYINGSNIGKSETINLLVRNQDSSLVAQNRVVIDPVYPEIVFYENNPYYGLIFDSAIKNNFEMKGAEIEVLAVPYNLSRQTPSSLKYEWRLNNNLIPELNGLKSVIFKKPEDEEGTSKISLSIENLSRFLQYGESSVLLKFNK